MPRSFSLRRALLTRRLPPVKALTLITSYSLCRPSSVKFRPKSTGIIKDSGIVNSFHVVALASLEILLMPAAPCLVSSRPIREQGRRRSSTSCMASFRRNASNRRRRCSFVRYLHSRLGISLESQPLAAMRALLHHFGQRRLIYFSRYWPRESELIEIVVILGQWPK